MKKTIRVLAILLALAALLSAGSAFAADNWLFLQTFASRSEDMLLMLADPSGAEELPAAEQLQVSFNGDALTVAAVDRAVNEPVTYYCIADISGLSKNPGQLQMEKDILYAFCDNLREGDKMVFATMGEELVASDYLTDQAELRSLIDGLSPSDQQTNLYRSLVDAITDLSSTDKATTRKCLVLLSDGQNYYTESQFQGAVKDRADDAIKNSRIPAYTVAIITEELAADKDWYLRDIYPLFLSLSEESAGGRSFNPLIDRDVDTGEKVAMAVMNSVKNDLLLTLDMSGYQKQADFDALPNLIPLSVQYTGTDGRLYSDSMTVEKSALSLEIEEAPFPWYYIAAIAGAVAVIAAIVIILAVNGKRKRQKEEEERQRREQEKAEQQRREQFQQQQLQQQQYQQEQLQQQLNEQQLQQQQLQQQLRQQELKQQQEAERERLAKEKAKVYRTVSFSIVGSKPDNSGKKNTSNIGRKFTLRVPDGETVTVGRNDRANLILNPEDGVLSSVHFRLLCKGRTLRVWDGNGRQPSTNGTWVDGAWLQGENSTLLKDFEMQDHMIGAGQYEYRIRFED